MRLCLQSAVILAAVSFWPYQPEIVWAQDPVNPPAAGGLNVSPPADAPPDGGSPAAAGAVVPTEKCSCEERPALPKLLEQSSISFVGRVERLDNNPRRPGFVEVTFTVLNRFKGFEEVKTQKVLIYTPKEGSCSYAFRIGLDYLVFASGTPANFKADTCSGTEILENSYTDIERLKRMTANDPSNRMPSDDGR